MTLVNKTIGSAPQVFTQVIVGLGIPKNDVANFFALRTEEAIDSIAGVKSPVVTFAVTVSLRWDVFADVDVSLLRGKKLNNVQSTGHRTVPFESECHKVFKPGPNKPKVMYAGKGGCAFAQISNTDVASFETAQTLELKMTNAINYSSRITKGRLVMGWFVYNVTGGLSPNECNGSAHRLRKMRDIIDMY
ncbi:hypothetical protein MRX96_026169 [Rhipicephalus microplus]